MPLLEAIALAARAIWGARLRSFFTLLGIIVSVAFLVMVVAVIQGMNAYVSDNLRGAMTIRPCNIGFAAYYDSAGRVDLMDAHPGEKPVVISGSKVREALTTGERPDPRILRPEIADILIDYYRSKA